MLSRGLESAAPEGGSRYGVRGIRLRCCGWGEKVLTGSGLEMLSGRLRLQIKILNFHYVLASTGEEGWGAALNEALEEGMNAIGTFEAGASAAMLPKERLYHTGDVVALARLLEREARNELPPCSIGEWTAEKAAESLV